MYTLNHTCRVYIGALAAAAAREAAMRVAFLCLAHRALTPLRFTEPSVSPTSAPRPFLRPAERCFLEAMRRAPPAAAFTAAASAAPRVDRVAAAASPAHVRLRVSAAEVCSRTNAQMARCSRRTSSSRSRRAAASAAAAQMRSKRWPVRGARPQGDSACRDLGVHVHVDRLERLPPAPPASPAPRARRLPAPVSSQHGAALTTAARVTSVVSLLKEGGLLATLVTAVDYRLFWS